MNGGLDHRRWRADLAAYMLGALEPDETVALESHLQGCSRCREELRWLQPAVDMLPESVGQLDPPPELRERLLAEVHAEAGATRAQSAEAVEPRRAGGGLRRLFLRPAVALGTVALAAAAVAGYSIGVGGDDGGTTTTVAAKGVGELRATLERSGDEGTLQMTGLHQAPSSHVYQAWVEHGEKIDGVSLFDARHNGTANVAIPHSLEGADAVMVTIEPRGGSEKPSGNPLVNVSLDD